MCLEVVFCCLGIALVIGSGRNVSEISKFPFRFAYEARKVFEKQEFFLYLLKHFYLHYINFFLYIIEFMVWFWCFFFFTLVFSLLGNVVL